MYKFQAACQPPHAWWARPVAARRQRRRQGGSGSSSTLCQAGAKSGDVGQILRDALQQPQQGQNLTYLAAGNWLRGLGIESQPEINRILDIAMNPNSMFTSRDRKQPTNPHARKLDVEADLKPLLAFLQGEAGMSQEQIVKIISAHPALLSYSVPDRLQPFFAYLTGELGLSQQEAASVVQQRPTLVGVEVDNLRRMVGYLLEAGNSREAVLEMLATTL
ncbi:hypothetical protein COHA_008447 [Chlorella ohadii]|uniref:Uncharacterized protein n=1 Tax=Chlorella ohadii TaxID=2649997 RepID=A0AAD5H2H2_9CHLO|nr:hypothetical protein COHA_008447 [Chlorella ohadii]